MIRAVLAALLALTAALPAALHGQTAPPAAAPATAQDFVQRFDNLHLTLTLPAAWGMSKNLPAPGQQASAFDWKGKIGETPLLMAVVILGRYDYGLTEPSDILELVASQASGPGGEGEGSFRYDVIEHISGPYGYAAYASYARGAEASDEGEVSDVYRFAGLTPDAGYLFEIHAKSKLGDAEAKQIRDALVQGIRYDGELRDPQWTKAETEERWQAGVPEDLQGELKDALRTAHYIILTNSSGGKTFAKKMEECYVAVKKIFPFAEVPERRLLPVFLFRTNDQYFEFIAKTFGMTIEAAKRTGGIASGDFYATWYEAPGDPVHIHEATHQIFANRLGLGGGGSWYQEGVAEYMSSKDNERGAAARAVTKGRHVPLREFMALESLIFSTPADDISGADQAGDHYQYAALIIEFLRESKFGKAKFQEWLHAVGSVPRNHVTFIEAATQRVYGVDLAGLEAAFVTYCKKR
ncbi:MAG: hypothetical protein ACT4PU_04445 [Planctomycetota bacterium]